MICAVLEICSYMEEKGSGFDKIEEDYSGYSENYQPYISADASSFTLTLPDLTWQGGISESSNSVPEVYTEAILSGKNDLHILAFCYSRKRTAKEIAEELHIQPSTYFRQSVLARLVDQGFLLLSKSEKVSFYQSNPNQVFLKKQNYQ